MPLKFPKNEALKATHVELPKVEVPAINAGMAPPEVSKASEEKEALKPAQAMPITRKNHTQAMLEKYGEPSNWPVTLGNR